MAEKSKIRLSLTGGTAELYKRDALRLLNSLPPESIDFVITSPPYCIGKEYEKSISAADFTALHRKILPAIERVVPGVSPEDVIAIVAK